MSKHTDAAEKIIASIKGLRNHLQPDEQPIMTIPAIWDNGQKQHSDLCNIILTNQRLFGYYCASFPRERLFLDDLALSDISVVSLRHKSFEPIFRELMVSAGQRKVYIRAPHQKIETLYTALRMASESYAPEAESTFEQEPTNTHPRRAPAYGRQEIRNPFENSPLAITILFVGGVLLEVVAVILWLATHSLQVGLPLFIAGFAAVVTSILIRRQRR